MPSCPKVTPYALKEASEQYLKVVQEKCCMSAEAVQNASVAVANAVEQQQMCFASITAETVDAGVAEFHALPKKDSYSKIYRKFNCP